MSKVHVELYIGHSNGHWTLYNTEVETSLPSEYFESIDEYELFLHSKAESQFIKECKPNDVAFTGLYHWYEEEENENED